MIIIKCEERFNEGEIYLLHKFCLYEVYHLFQRIFFYYLDLIKQKVTTGVLKKWF